MHEGSNISQEHAPRIVFRELGAAAALALIEGVQQVAAAALLAKPLTLAGPLELGHLDVHLHSRHEGNCASHLPFAHLLCTETLNVPA